MNKGIILTHGNLGQALLSTAEKIVGELEGIKVISNEHTSLKDLISSVENALTGWLEEDVIIMIDFSGGSCWHAAQVVQRGKQNVSLISGVNLPMMLAFINRRESYKMQELSELLRDSSINGISVICGQLSLNSKKDIDDES